MSSNVVEFVFNLQKDNPVKGFKDFGDLNIIKFLEKVGSIDLEVGSIYCCSIFCTAINDYRSSHVLDSGDWKYVFDFEFNFVQDGRMMDSMFADVYRKLLDVFVVDRTHNLFEDGFVCRNDIRFVFEKIDRYSPPTL
jgi:hypothetical protein